MNLKVYYRGVYVCFCVHMNMNTKLTYEFHHHLRTLVLDENTVIEIETHRRAIYKQPMYVVDFCSIDYGY